jgi:hypothetical protein
VFRYFRVFRVFQDFCIRRLKRAIPGGLDLNPAGVCRAASLRARARRRCENFVYENANRLELHSIGWRFRFRFTYNSTDSNRVRRQLK